MSLRRFTNNGLSTVNERMRSGRSFRSTSHLFFSAAITKYLYTLLDQCREGGVQFLVGDGTGDSDLLTNAARCLFDLLQLERGRRKVRVEQDPDKRGARGKLPQ